MTTTNKIRGNVVVSVQGQPARPKWERLALQKALGSGLGAEQQLRFVCRIAQDANIAFERIEDADGNVWVLNPKAKAQFGRNLKGLGYLTVGLINEATDERVRLTWEGDAVPSKMKEVAVAHDEGKRVSTTRIRLRLEDAKHVITRDHRTPQRREAAARYKATKLRDPNYTPATRSHGRLCRDDIA